jgi:hypothetical protein
MYCLYYTYLKGFRKGFYSDYVDNINIALSRLQDVLSDPEFDIIDYKIYKIEYKEINLDEYKKYLFKKNTHIS